MDIRAGVVTAAEVNGPMATPSSGSDYADPSAPSLWATVWFVVAILVLFVL